MKLFLQFGSKFLSNRIKGIKHSIPKKKPNFPIENSFEVFLPKNSFSFLFQSSKFHSYHQHSSLIYNYVKLENLNSKQPFLKTQQTRSAAGLFVEKNPPPESSRHPFVPRRMGGDGRQLPTQDKLYPLGFFWNVIAPTTFTAIVVFALTRWANFHYDTHRRVEIEEGKIWREQFNHALKDAESKPDLLDRWIIARDARELGQKTPIVIWKIQELGEFLATEAVAEKTAQGMDDPTWLNQLPNAPQLKGPNALQAYWDIAQNEMLPFRFGRFTHEANFQQLEASINMNAAAADIQEVFGHYEKYKVTPWLLPVDFFLFYGPIMAMPFFYFASKFQTTWGFLHRFGAKSPLTKKSPHTLLTSVLVHKNLPHFLGVYTGLLTEGFFNLLQRRKNDRGRELSHEHTWSVFLGGQVFGGLISNFSRIFFTRSLLPCWGGVPGFFALMGSYRVHSPESPFFGYHSAINVLPSLFFIPGENLNWQTFRVILVGAGFCFLFKVNPDLKVPAYPIEWSRIRFTAWRRMAFYAFLMRFDYPGFAGGAIFGILYTLYLEKTQRTKRKITFYSPMVEFKDGIPATEDYIGSVDPPGPPEFNTPPWHAERDFDNPRDPNASDLHYHPKIPERIRKAPPLPVEIPIED